ncbi:hypothetical protein FB107DRAFT_252772 [Schizophyllum commune]
MVANQPAWQASSGWKGTTWPLLPVKMRAAVANGTLNADLTNLTPEKISSHWVKPMKPDYKQVKELCKNSSFGWDEKHHRDGWITSTTKYDPWGKLKPNPYMRWKKHPFPIFRDMATLCKKVITTGDQAYHASTQSVPPPAPPGPPTPPSTQFPIDPVLLEGEGDDGKHKQDGDEPIELSQGRAWVATPPPNPPSPQHAPATPSADPDLTLLSPLMPQAPVMHSSVSVTLPTSQKKSRGHAEAMDNMTISVINITNALALQTLKNKHKVVDLLRYDVSGDNCPSCSKHAKAAKAMTSDLDMALIPVGLILRDGEGRIAVDTGRSILLVLSVGSIVASLGGDFIVGCVLPPVVVQP